MTQSVFLSDLCPPEGRTTADTATTHRTSFFTPRYYRHLLSLRPSEPPRTTRTDTGPRVPRAIGGDPLTPCPAGPDIPRCGVSPASSSRTEEEAPLLVISCPATLQTGTTQHSIRNRLFDMLGFILCFNTFLKKKAKHTFIISNSAVLSLCQAAARRSISANVTEKRPSVKVLFK